MAEPLNEFGVSCEIRGSSFVDGGAEVGDELHFESLGKAGGAAEISQGKSVRKPSYPEQYLRKLSERLFYCDSPNFEMRVCVFVHLLTSQIANNTVS